MTNAIRWIKQFAEKNPGKVWRAYLKEAEAQHITYLLTYYITYDIS